MGKRFPCLLLVFLLLICPGSGLGEMNFPHNLSSQEALLHAVAETAKEEGKKTVLCLMAGSDMLIMSGLMGMYPILFSVTGIPFSVFKSFLSSVIINLKKSYL